MENGTFDLVTFNIPKPLSTVGLLKVCPKTHLCYFYPNQGVTYYQQGKYDIAIESYQKAIRINPNFAVAHNSLGVAYEKQGKYDLAVKSYKKAISINPNNAETHYSLGTAYATQGKYDLAVKSYKKAIAINPNLDSPKLGQFINPQ